MVDRRGFVCKAATLAGAPAFMPSVAARAAAPGGPSTLQLAPITVKTWLLVIHHNGRDHPERLLVVQARSFVKRHPLAGRRKQSQRSTSFGATSAGTFSTSRHDSKLI